MKKILLATSIIIFFAACKKDSGSINTNQGDPVDIDGNKYPTVKICNQTWLAKNLNVSKYRNGDPIPQVQDDLAWENLTTGAWCYYENVTANGTTYGKLYNWYAVNDPRGLAPQGWHIPSDDEWTTLMACLGGESEAGGKMKTIGTLEQSSGLWKSPNGGASNSSGFNGIPAGSRDYDGTFRDVGFQTNFWSSIGTASGDGINYGLSYFEGILNRDFLYKETGYSVRCIKD